MNRITFIVGVAVSKWALKNITRLRNVKRLKAYIQSFSGTLHKFIQFCLIVLTYLVRLLVSKSKQSSKSTKPSNTQPPKSAKPLNKVITFVGATSSGKSSTINALIGYSAFSVGVGHGTTLKVSEVNYVHGYQLRDTPGLLDSNDFSSLVLSAIEDSELVIGTRGMRETQRLLGSRCALLQHPSHPKPCLQLSSHTATQCVIHLSNRTS